MAHNSNKFFADSIGNEVFSDIFKRHLIGSRTNIKILAPSDNTQWMEWFWTSAKISFAHTTHMFLCSAAKVVRHDEIKWPGIALWNESEYGDRSIPESKAIEVVKSQYWGLSGGTRVERNNKFRESSFVRPNWFLDHWPSLEMRLPLSCNCNHVVLKWLGMSVCWCL